MLKNNDVQKEIYKEAEFFIEKLNFQ